MKKDAIGYLKDTLKDKQSERDRKIELERDNKDRLRAIGDAPSRKMEDFWCNECKIDFVGRACKRINWVFNIDTGVSEPPKKWQAWYEGRCDKGHRVIRAITDKDIDPYYFHSDWVKRQQYEHADDFLTPDDPRFRIKYPAAWARLQEQYGTQNPTTN